MIFSTTKTSDRTKAGGTGAVHGVTVSSLPYRSADESPTFCRRFADTGKTR